jgi:glycosyltransferase involved in cell wall biosynthesis
MAGIGIRYLRLAQELAMQLGDGYTVELLSPAPDAAADDADDVHEDDVSAEASADQSSARPILNRIEPGRLVEQLAGAHCVVAQGQLANDVLIQCPELAVAIDLYDPWLIENLHYFESMGLDPYRNDHATWLLQLSRGDYFLCSSAEQRLFYLGFLTAVGRVNPHSVADDPELAARIGIVPFGIDSNGIPSNGTDENEQAYQTYLEATTPRPRRLLFGGLYDWYDPMTTLEAFELLLERRDLERRDSDDLELLFIRNPNPGHTPQRRVEQVEAWRRKSSARVADRVRFLDWVPYERRFDLLRDVDLLVSTHLPGLETDLSLRTRFLEALAAGCPVVVTEGGALGRQLERFDAGWLVAPKDKEALCAAFEQILAGGDAVATRVERGRALASEFAWPKVVAPLLQFCRNPVKDASALEFSATLATRAPADTTAFRIRRRLGLWLDKAGKAKA